MRFVRAASVDEVLQACPDDAGTRQAVLVRGPFAVWEFSGADLGGVGAQLPQEVASVGIHLPNDGVGTIGVLAPHWTRWIQSREEVARRDREGHAFFLAWLRTGKPFIHRPIVFDERMQIHDGKHRLFAAFDHGGDAPDLKVEVFWNRLPRE